MSISAFALIFLTIYVGIAQLDALSVKIGLFSPVFGGAVTGLVMGDLKTGLIVGATLQLATLGVATYGGATVPDFLSGSIMGSAFAIMSGRGAAYGIGLAIPIGLLLTQMDILARMTNTIFQHHADRLAEKGDYKGVERNNLYGIIPWTVSRMLPVFVGLFFGSAVVKAINAWIPAWLMVGLKTAGIILPAMGIAILMRYLPLKRYFPYFILGFVLMAYFMKTFSLLGTALVGFVFAALHVLDANDRKRNESNSHGPSNHNNGGSNGGDDSDEEVEIDV
ncbi:PTS sorbose transporter subunit IIC [Lactobacillus paracasei]|uniref:PTS mannose/fructose/sorbose/N-acetylgalactosamine transporter subunit IIC n=1 Tax=Lacticaseibacillus paracasei TaxID=1597 RepID=UPI000D33F8A9|nr:PTS sugar transporter subunit IIC [Lacticaseibacillus paracasei]PTS55651.1 PTS sorbose transporter subunit IIC [Lactobacillus sp. DS22_6]MBS6631407.1 PTS sugar transporter subunit IIC [Lacticaseibacillus paracasei]MBX4166779.1 PTS sugar transporter subunit IIC [Lacticaseibacillus paracasei]MCZ2753291.1 PTS sugar transporter subunit IIC [Lacticaseibacillus paracasei]MCZ2763717.1 PTS sugar transporter subunit IIC [Lacticaseibacillus paracasei]